MVYSCLSCDRYFDSERALEQHQQDSAAHKKTILCNICHRYFGTKEALEQHEQNSPVHKKTVHCKVCDRYFGSKEALEEHEKASPVHQMPFACEICSCCFGNKKALKTHRRNCRVRQDLPDHSLNASLERRRDSAWSSNIQARPVTLDKASVIIKQHASMLASVNPATIIALEKTLRESTAESAQETREFFTFPELHENIVRAVLPDMSSPWFQEDDDDDLVNDEWLTHVMGVFVCRNGSCKAQIWASRMVPIEIRGYDGNGYGAIVYNQRCKSCNELGTFVLDEDSYVERVSYRLKKWAGVAMELPYYGPKKGLPHERKFCEGCKRGKCEEGDRLARYLTF